MASSRRIATEDDDTINLIEIWRAIWSHKYLILGTALLGFAVAVVLALLATPIYRAEAVVTEVRDSGMGAGSSSLASQLGGLASIAGLNLASSGGPGQEAQAVLTSRRLVEEFVKRERLIPVLFPEGKPTPTLWRAVEQFRNGVVSVQPDKRNGMTTVRIEWTDPATAARWANSFVALANEMVRTRALQDASRSIEYLNKQIAQTNVLEVQRVMYNLIESQTKTLMLANARTEYALTVIDPAVPPEIRVSPKRTLMAGVGLVLGLFLGMAIALCRHAVLRARAVTVAAGSGPQR